MQIEDKEEKEEIELTRAAVASICLPKVRESEKQTMNLPRAGDQERDRALRLEQAAEDIRLQ